MPAGRLPLLTDHAYGPVPPLTISVSEYAVFTSPNGGAGKLRAGAAMMISVVAWVALCPLASVTLIVKLDVPTAVGVPDRVPVDEPRVIPAGSVPLLTDQVYGAVPPLAVSV